MPGSGRTRSSCLPPCGQWKGTQSAGASGVTCAAAAPATSALREGRPCQPTPFAHVTGSDKPYRVSELADDNARIEGAFRALFWRAEYAQRADSVDVVCCHANVIRYFVMRALQLPPEAWLRVSLTHASITLLQVRSSGHVTLLTLGDSSGLPTDHITRANV